MTVDGFPRVVLLYGTGLIGASIGLALKEQIPGIRIYGVDAPEVLERAQRVGAVDAGPRPASDVPDVIILAAPVGTILQLLDEVAPTEAAVLFDVGSTKAEICRKAEGRGLAFVGGHPMT